MPTLSFMKTSRVQTNMTYQPFRHIQHHNMITHISSHVYKLSGWRKIVLNFCNGILTDFPDKFVHSTTLIEFMQAHKSQSFYPERADRIFLTLCSRRLFSQTLNTQ